MKETLRLCSPQSPSYVLCVYLWKKILQEILQTRSMSINVATTDLVFQTCYWHAAVKCQSSAVFKRLRRRAVLHNRHRRATSLCILLPLFKYFVWTGYNHFHTSQHSKVLVDTGSCAQLGLQMMCSWRPVKSYLVSVGAVQVHNHHPHSYIKHQTLSKCFQKVSKRKCKPWVSIAFWYVDILYRVQLDYILWQTNTNTGGIWLKPKTNGISKWLTTWTHWIV